MKITHNEEWVEIDKGIFVKNPKIVDIGNIKFPEKKQWTHTFALTSEAADGSRFFHDNIPGLALAFYGDKSVDPQHSNRQATYTDGETEETDDPNNPGQTIDVLIQKDLVTYIMANIGTPSFDPWTDTSITISELGYADYVSVQGYFDNNTPKLEFNSALPPMLVKLGQEVALKNLTIEGIDLKSLGFQF